MKSNFFSFAVVSGFCGLLLLSGCEPASLVNNSESAQSAPRAVPDGIASGIVSSGVSLFRSNLIAYKSEDACRVVVTIEGADVVRWVQSSGDVSPSLLRDIVELCTGRKLDAITNKVYSEGNQGSVLWFTDAYMYPVDVELRDGSALIQLRTPSPMDAAKL